MDFLDIIGQILWFSIPIIPISSVFYVVWKYRKEKIFVAILIKTIITTLVLSIFLFLLAYQLYLEMEWEHEKSLFIFHN
ncbi:hypothetical protein ACE193_00845 [Bernardetia sp. OM2101]|uniref:hypothetical protein n=1 Tax=Bernardetia sp. OM2101 TaxID=3344876 RepID=UPI0035D01611